MAQYIDKSALVAEIEKSYNECLKRAKITDSDYWNAKADAYRNVLVSLDNTLEVKEVNFEKIWKEYCGHSGDVPAISAKPIAKHFFELGMAVSNKIQKGE